MNDLAHCLEDSTQRELQAQLYRYAEDMYLLMSEHDALQQRFRSLDQAHRSVSEYRELLSLLMHSTNEAYLATDGDGRIIHHTRPASQLLGAEDLAGSSLGAYIADDELPDFVAWLGNASGKAEVEEVRRIHLRHDGERHPAAEALLIRCPSPDPCHRHWIVRPRLEHNSVDTPVSTDERNGSGIFVSDDKGRILTVNAAFTRITGHPAETVRGESLQQLIHTGSDSENFFRQLWEQLRVAGSWQGEIANRRRNGETYPQWLALDCIRNGDGSITGYFARIHDLSRIQDSERQLSRLAYYDFLTGLPNRLLFNDRLTMAINQSRRDGRQMGVLFLDLDRFKQINDTLGHDVGDELLKIVAERLTGATREADTVARLGGDEFTVILPKLQKERDVHTVAAKILEIFQPPVLLAGQTLFATPSIGVAIFPDHGNDASTLLRHADSAMYRAKNDGGNMYHLFEAADDGDSRVLSIECAFRNALARNELYLVYQPQIAANRCAINGVEALLRWRSPEFGEVSPDTFIPIAEWSGMILEIGQWVLHTACRQAALWRQSGLPIQRVAVNISPRQLRAPDFSTWVLQALADSDLPGEALELEITESELMLYPESTLIKLAELRSRGVSVAIDDFGTGYSSLARLRSLPIDRIKVDRSFVRDLENDGDAQAISSCIVTMARVMNIEVIAEGVETTGQLRYLLDQGCHTIQGFLFAQPMPPEAIGNYLASLLQSEEAP